MCTVLKRSRGRRNKHHAETTLGEMCTRMHGGYPQAKTAPSMSKTEPRSCKPCSRGQEIRNRDRGEDCLSMQRNVPNSCEASNACE